MQKFMNEPVTRKDLTIIFLTWQALDAIDTLGGAYLRGYYGQ